MEQISGTLRFRMFIQQLVKYGISGFIAFLVDVSILYFLTEYGNGGRLSAECAMGLSKKEI